MCSFNLLVFIVLAISVASVDAATPLTKVLLTTGSVSEREAVRSAARLDP